MAVRSLRGAALGSLKGQTCCLIAARPRHTTRARLGGGGAE